MDKNPFESNRFYNKSRELIRLLFLYGCYSKEQLLEKLDFSSRFLEREIHRLRDLFGDEMLCSEIISREAYFNMGYEYLTHIENYLVESYYSKSSTKKDFSLYFLILQILYDAPHLQSKRTIADALNICKDELVEEITVHRKLQELSSWGLIDCKKDSKAFYYSLKEDLFHSFTNDELKEIHYAISFFSNTKFPCVPGNYLKKTLEKYIIHHRGFSLGKTDLFLYSHRYFHPVLEEEIIWSLLTSLHSNTLVRIKYNSRNTGLTSIKEVAPIKLVHDLQYGRWYLLGKDQSEQYSIYRIDRITEIHNLQEKYDLEKLRKEHNPLCEKSWVVAPLDILGKTKKIRALFKMDLDQNHHYQRFLKELNWGSIERIDHATILLEIDVTDPSEIKPWLRSFGPAMEILSSEEHNLREELTAEWKELLESYGIIS